MAEEATLQDVIDDPSKMPDDPEAIERLAAEMAGDDEIGYGKNTDDPAAPGQATADEEAKAAAKAAEEAETAAKAAAGEKQEGDEPGEETKGDVLSRDGEHTIPFKVLEGSRAEAQRLKEENQRLVEESQKLQEQLESAKKPDENAGDDDDKLAGEVTPEQEFERLYGVSVEDFREEYGDVQATMFLNQVSENLVLKQQLGEVNSAFKSQQEQEQANVQQSLQDAIDANPVLSDIQQNNPALWEAAVAMNGYLLKTDDEYFEKGFAERMSYIAEQISPSKTSTGSEDKPANGEIPKPEPKTPTSLTDFPGSGESVDQTELDRIASMSDGELDRVMADPVMADRILANL